MRREIIQKFLTGFSWSAYWTQHNDLWVKEGTRSGLSLPDSLGGSPVTILPSCSGIFKRYWDCVYCLLARKVT